MLNLHFHLSAEPVDTANLARDCESLGPVETADGLGEKPTMFFESSRGKHTEVTLSNYPRSKVHTRSDV